MVYLEYLRVRRAFIPYAIVIALLVAVSVVSALFGSHATVNIDDATPQGSSHHAWHGLGSLGIVPIPMEGYVGTAAILALAFATALAASFNRDTQYAHFLFVRPVSRIRMALATIAVDIAGVIAAGLFGLVVAFLGTWIVFRDQAHFIWAPDTFAVGLLGFGSAVMWYALLQAFSAWTSRRGGIFVGIGAATLGFAIPLSKATFLGPITYLFKAILLIDPLAYFTSVSMKGDGDVVIGAQFAETLVLRTIIVWVLAAVALAIATISWNRVEV